MLTLGDSFQISPGVRHVVDVLSDKPARVLVGAAPGNFARFIEAAETTDDTETVDLALIERITAEIGDELLDSIKTLPT